ncbi:putative transporter AQR1, partial [Trichoderma ghanense]
FKRFRRSKTQPKGGNDRKASDSSIPTLTVDGRSIDESVASADPLGSSSRPRSQSPAPAPAGLGLRVLHQPEFASLDIVFVHGLGGHSQKTWTKNHDPGLFWPEIWLPFEPDVGKARILTFGYEASWRGGAGISGITDFAKELLYEMRFSKDASGADIALGQNPIIFVVHSMGGLVVKKAYLLGLYDENYKDIVSSVSAIIFLSTPHRGTNLAETLNRVLAASFHSSKHFIADLNKNSTAIEELNEQFRHLAPRLSIWSFYETLATSIGPKKLMVLEKDSSVLGYPAEISRPLRADHHDVCKYSSPVDSNYLSVRNALKSLVTAFRSRAVREADVSEPENTTDIHDLFRNCHTSEEEYSRLRLEWIPDTCEWVFKESEVQQWMKPSMESHILWYTAPPASGKSMLAAFIISRLKDLGLDCEYFLFSYAEQRKRSVAASLKAIALQLAKDLPEFRKMLSGSSQASLGLESTDASLIWRNTFEKLLFRGGRSKPVYWVFDALDESDSPKSFLECLRGLSSARIPVKILVLSRNTNTLSVGFDRLSHANVQVSRMECSVHLHSKKDIQLLVESEIRHLGGSDHFRQQLTKTIMTRSEGNFLWTKLVLEEILRCDTEDNIREVLDDIPNDMISLYQRMERTLVDSTRKSNKPLIRTLLEWTICAQRSLGIQELSQALRPEFSGLFDLRRTIHDSCGQFLHVDGKGKVNILHHTAREYFTSTLDSQFYIDVRETHGKLFVRTLAQLEEEDLRWRLIQNQHALQASEPFLFYAAVNWPYHLAQSHSSSSEYLDLLVKFFQSPAVLAWIHALALLRRLEVLVRASKALASFVQRTRKQDVSKNPLLHRLSDLALLDEWIIDLVKLVGKFGPTLVTDPSVIYDMIPAFCPTKSAVHRQYYDPRSAKIKLLGTRELSWNDNLGRLVLQDEAQARTLACAGNHLAVLASTGVVHVWDSSNFTQVGQISHGEPVTAMALNDNGHKLVTYGLKTSKTWSVVSGKLLSSTANPPNTKAMVVTFADNDRKLLVGGDDNIIRHIHCDKMDEGWQVLNPALLKETGRIDGAIVSSPMCLSFSGDNSLVGVSYRGAPLSVWRLADGLCLNRCKRAKDFHNDQNRTTSNWFAVDRFTWNPVTNHIIGIYKNGSIFKWHHFSDENVEARVAADEIAASPNGKVFATSSSNGSVRVWNFAYFTVIYHLSSEDLVTGLAFSPDSGRFYDLRGGSINAWESSTLTRFLESEETVSDTNSEDQSFAAFSRHSESHVKPFEPVTALAAEPDGSSYCAGYEDGTVVRFQRGATEGVDFARFHNFLNVSHIQWSADAKHVAVADLAGDMQVKSVHRDVKGGDKVLSLPSPQIDLDGDNIEQLVFNTDSTLLLISTRKKSFVCSVNEGTVLCSLASDDAASLRQWLPHPTQTTLILAFGAHDVVTYTWDKLDSVGSSSYKELQNPGLKSQPSDDVEALAEGVVSTQLVSSIEAGREYTVTSAILTQDAKYVLLKTKTVTQDRKTSHRVSLFPIDGMHSEDACTKPPSTLGYLHIPPDISSHIKVPLGVLPGSKFIFLDHDLWLCSYFLEPISQNDTAESYDRLYFIPRDWVGSTSLDSCCMAKDGTLFWPKDDHVVLILSNLDEPRRTEEKPASTHIKDEKSAPISSDESLPAAAQPAEPYTIFSKAQLRRLQLLLGIATITSPLTATIYFPLLPLLREQFHASAQAINLTLTLYIIFQALSPALFGPLSDSLGRRPFFLLTLGLYVIANIGLAVNTSNYAVLLVLRAIQSLGASAAYAISFGVVADVCESSDRGRMLGPISMALNLGACVGPVVGGVVAYTSGSCMIDLLACLRIIFYKDTFLALWVHGSFYTVDYSFVAAVPDVYKEAYGYNDLQLGLTYLPRGVGIIMGSYCTGKMMDSNYRAVKRATGRADDVGNRITGGDLLAFPVELARTRFSLHLLTISTATIIGYGWAVERSAPAAALLVLQFIQGFWGTAFYTTYGALVVDGFPDRPGTAAAATSLTRCAMAAAGVARWIWGGGCDAAETQRDGVEEFEERNCS